MVNYPNLKKAPANMSIPKKSTSKHYTAFRGMSFEEDINLTNNYFLSVDQAVKKKKPTPPTPTKPPKKPKKQKPKNQ